MSQEISEKNSTLIIFYLYLTSIIALFSFLDMAFILEVSLLIGLIGVSLVTNNFKVPISIVLFYMTLIVFSLFLAPTMSNARYPLGELANVLLYSFVPIYLFSQNNIDYGSILAKWKKTAILFSALLPVLLVWREFRFIFYYEFGYVAHLNILIFVLYFFVKKEYKPLNFFLIGYNAVALLLWGSRLVLLSTAITSLLIILFLTKEKLHIKILKFILVIFIVGMLFVNLSTILVAINSVLKAVGIDSRNITLLMKQLEGGIDAVIGDRQDFYPQMLEYVKQSLGVPRGFGVIRSMTDGVYYHAHNFIIQFVLTFGLGSLLAFLTYTFIYYIQAGRRSVFADSKRYLLFIGITSFFFRSIAGTNFYNDYIFYIIVGILFSSNVIENKNKQIRHDFTNYINKIRYGGNNENING